MMRQAWASALNSSLLLLRPRRAPVGAVLVLVAVVAQTWVRGTGSLSGFGPLHGVATGAEVLVRLLPIFCCVVVSAWVGALCSKEHATELHLMGQRRAVVAGIATIAVTLISVALVVVAAALSAAAGAWLAQPPSLLPGAQIVAAPTGFHWRLALLPLVAVLWTCLGAAVGIASNSAVAAVAGVLVLYSSGFILERLGLVQPAMLEVLAWHPNGISSSLVNGTSVPLYPASATTGTQTSAAVLIWVALIAWSLTRSNRTQGQTADREIKIERSLVLIGLSTVLIVIGHVVPDRLAASIPWEYKIEWRTMVAEKRTPADEMRKLILAEGRRTDSAAGLDPESRSALNALIRSARNRELPIVATDDLQATRPGSVVVNVGADETDANGTIRPAPQFGACLTWQSDAWVLQTVSRSGVTCTD